MKTKKEILQEYLDSAREHLIKIEVSTSYLQNKYAKENKQHILDELSKLKADQSATEDWKNYIEEQLTKEK